MRSVTFAFSLVSLVTILVSAASANGYDSEDEALRLLDQKWREYEVYCGWRFVV